MPWTGATFAKHNHGIHGAQLDHAARIASGALRSGVPEGEAIAIGSGWAKRHHRDDGGAVGDIQTGIAPSSQTMNPLVQSSIQRYAGLPTEKLAELVSRLGPSQQGQLAQKVLQQKRMMPQPMAPQTQQQTAPNSVPGAPNTPAASTPVLPPPQFRQGGVIRRDLGGQMPPCQPFTSGSSPTSTPSQPSGMTMGSGTEFSNGFGPPPPQPSPMPQNAGQTGLWAQQYPSMGSGTEYANGFGPPPSQPPRPPSSSPGPLFGSSGNDETPSYGTPSPLRFGTPSSSPGGFQPSQANNWGAQFGRPAGGHPLQPLGAAGMESSGTWARGGAMPLKCGGANAERNSEYSPLNTERSMKRAQGGDMGISPSMASPWWTRAEARGADSGFLHGTTPGRADSVLTTAPGGAYVLPADVIAGLGEGNSLAGARVADAMFSSGPHGIGLPRGGRGMGPPRPPPAFREGVKNGGPIKLFKGGAGGAKKGTDVALSHGEYVISPEKCAELGGGDAKRGHRILDAWVVEQRKRQVKKIKSLPGPVKT